MITDMVNLGPPLKALPDLKTANRRSEDKPVEKDPGSFEQVLGEKSVEKTTGKTADKLSRGQPERGKAPIPDKAKEGNTEPAKMAASAQKNENKEDSKVDPDTKDSVEAKSLSGEKAKEVGQKPKLSERQKVMQKFMDSVESEFGVPPERVVEAMAQLSDKELLQSPEETAPQVISKLDLDPVESEKAEAMYLAMVTQLSGTLPQVKDTAPLQPQTKAFMQDALAGGGMAAILSSRERRQMLNNSLDRMNSSFFLKPEMKLPTEVVPMNAQEVGTERLFNQNYLKSQQMDPSGPNLLDVKTALAQQGVDPKTLSLEAQAKMAELQSQLNAVTKDMSTEDLRQAMVAMGATAAAADAAIKNDPDNANALRMEQALQGEQAAMVATPMGAGLAMANAQKGQESHGQSSGDRKGSDKESAKDFLNIDPSLAAPSKLSTGSEFVMPQVASGQAPPVAHNALAAGAGMTAAGTMPKSADNDANVQAVMKAAQYMIKKGGGEATVQMNPEGMGQVHLKVMLSEGKVNIEMKTENNETKKLLESSLGDLKASLGIHKMAVDHVKVDVNNQLSSQSDHQKSQEQFKQDPQREHARQFFNQFHEDNLSRREGFYETAGVKGYSRGKPVQPLKPGDEADSASTRRYQGSGKGSGLDLVA